jgi:hypothetical protein
MVVNAIRALALLGLLACDSGGGAVESPVVTPLPGRYQATLTGYLQRSCDSPALSDETGTFDAAFRVEQLSGRRIELFGQRLWPFGPVVLAPGDPNDDTERLAWVGTAAGQGDFAGCPLSATLTLRYFPRDPQHGTLHAQPRYTSTGRCTLPLPCENRAIWAMSHFP